MEDRVSDSEGCFNEALARVMVFGAQQTGSRWSGSKVPRVAGTSRAGVNQGTGHTGTPATPGPNESGSPGPGSPFCEPPGACDTGCSVDTSSGRSSWRGPLAILEAWRAWRPPRPLPLGTACHPGAHLPPPPRAEDRVVLAPALWSPPILRTRQEAHPLSVLGGARRGCWATRSSGEKHVLPRAAALTAASRGSASQAAQA